MNEKAQSAVKAAAGTIETHKAYYCLALAYDREEYRLMARKAEDKELPIAADEYHQIADLASGLHHAVFFGALDAFALVRGQWEQLLGAVIRREAYELVEADRARKLLADDPNNVGWGEIWKWERDRAERSAAGLAELKAKLTAVRDALRPLSA